MSCRFKIRDIETSTTLFEIAKPVGLPAEDGEEGGQQLEAGGQEEDEGEQRDEEGEGERADEAETNAGRFVRYQFTPQVGFRMATKRGYSTMQCRNYPERTF